MRNLKLVLIVIGIIIATCLCGFFFLQSFQNKAISYEEQINEAASGIKTQEKRRADLIPNLVDCVKQYDKHEYETMMDVVNARKDNDAESAQEIQTMVKAVAEAYPDLESNENYKALMTDLTTTENLIATYRENYTSCVKEYRRYVRKSPHRYILDFLGYEVSDYEMLDFDVSEDAPTNLFGD